MTVAGTGPGADGDATYAEAALPATSFDRWTGDPRFMLSLARGLLVLKTVVAGHGHPMAARQVAAHTGLSVGAAQRCLYTLHELGYVRANRNGAVPGTALAELASDYAASSPLIWACGPILDALHEELGVTTSLSMFEGDVPIIVASKTSDTLLRIEMPVGAIVPLHCTASGKIYLASLDDETLDRRLQQIDYQRHTTRTITSPAALKTDVAGVRRQGYAIADQELVAGMRSASVPVANSRGQVLASLNVAMLKSAVSLRDIRARLVPALIRGAAGLSRLLP